MDETRRETVATPYPPPARAWYLVGALMVFYVFSFIDRQVIAFLIGPMKRDMALTDTQVGLIQGFGFAVLYTFLGLPIGRLADRISRKKIVTVGVLVWSFMATMCGLAKTGTDLFLARVGVGVGEAALSPAAYSLITDSFPREKLGRAFGVYNMGIAIGSGIASLTAGLVIVAVSHVHHYTLPILGEVRGWQLVFIITGLPGALLPLLLITVREPARRGLLKAAGQTRAVPFSEVLAFVKANRSFYALHCVAFGLLAMVGYGVGAWLPEALVRAYKPEGLTIPQVAKVLGLATMFLNAAGIFSAGRLSDHLSAKGMRDAPIVVAVGVALAIVMTSSVTPFMPSLSLLWVALAIGAFPFSAYTSVGAMAINQVTPNQMRAQVSAIYLFVINVLGLGVGPALIPFINDKVFHDPTKIRYALSIVVIGGCLLAAVLLWLVRPIYREKHAQAAEWQ
ncbi:MAG TPA: MFS transporter [Polyangiaceae bacterium]|jgi:MFS family permease|nr:MFS transporter [Polyangiaceae bacterium]